MRNILPPTCKINYVNMQENYVNMQDYYVNMQEDHVNMQENYVNMQVTNVLIESDFNMDKIICVRPYLTS
jgi:hypothetical protein